jgi:PAS domain S-box-containing protein
MGFLGELSTWEEYKWRIVGALLLICLEAVLIGILLFERRRRQGAALRLRASERRYRELLENANDIIYTHDLTGNFTSFNKTGETISGYSRQEVCQMNIVRMVVPEHLNRVREMIDSSIAREDLIAFEMDILAKDGRPVSLDVSARLVFDGDQPVEVQGIARDITERKRAEGALVEWRNRYEAAVQSSNQILYDWDPKTNDVNYGGDLERILGYRPAELNGDIGRWLDLVHPEDRPAFNEEIERVIETGDSYHLVYRVFRKDGREIWLEDHGHFFRNDNHEIVRMVGLLDDLTERHRAAELIRQVNSELELRVAERTAELATKTRELEAFTYSVAHDLKAPLRGIDGYSRLLLEDHLSSLDDEGQTFLQRIEESTEQMKQLIDDLLAYSQVESCKMASTPIKLLGLVEGLLQERQSEIEQRGIEMDVAVDGAAALGDPNALAQVLRNYLDNALKFTRDVPNPRIEVGAKESAETCRLWVKDNGIGFDMNYHNQIFELFQRLHQQEDYPGTGIGLAIVRRAVERMGGRVWAESAANCGAAFYIEIPSSPVTLFSSGLIKR